MKKTFPLTIEGKNRDRVVEAVKNDIRKYMQRERRKALPPGVDFWDFDCRFGATADTAQACHVATLTELINDVAAAGGAQLYVELLAKPGQRTAKPASAQDDDAHED
ncbi:MAG: hypothetical protein CFE43_14230 [Burkholderiales bacterium PBB3]|nr:MAG: hypothetical protein CFE43_14230 [Burkholderiales bacterium PBB3]